MKKLCVSFSHLIENKPLQFTSVSIEIIYFKITIFNGFSWTGIDFMIFLINRSFVKLIVTVSNIEVVRFGVFENFA